MKFPKKVCFKVDPTSSDAPHQTFDIKTTLEVYISCTAHQKHLSNFERSSNCSLYSQKNECYSAKIRE